ncbi:hypothetical protein MKZ38_003116 [Zalerion maritima]|uniref:GPN-loop GTPase 3 n=1 Tax=Zalerion maritima TaxID=339359 RepID=A0AAD5RZ26_9PEZI|nr:hypothetical protein MKZ38_003116 [Zalerion maritima]
MSKFGVMVIGPAGAGKSTFCTALLTHLNLNRRSAFYVNLDPAAENFEHTPDLDIKELISVEDVMEDLHLGPNGGLVHCFEFLLENLDFLTEALDSLTEEYMIVFDMPGQIELYSHMPLIPTLVRHLSRAGGLDIRLCATYLLESTFMTDRSKFFAGTMAAMSAMVALELPHINVFSKMDLVKGQVRRKDIRKFLDPSPDLLDEDPQEKQRRLEALRDGREDPAQEEEYMDPNASSTVMRGASFRKLNRKVADVIENFGLVNFLELDVSKEDSVQAILSYIDDNVQWAEAQEPREPHDEMEVDDNV